MRGREHGAATALVAAIAGIVWVIAFLAMGESASAQTLEQAITAAYVNNPTLNAQRAAVRASDENVPRALSGYRPTVTGAASAARTALTTTTEPSSILGTPVPSTKSNALLNQSTLSLTLNQNLYNGFRTANNVRAAEAQVRQSQETLRATEQQVLLDAVTAHMNVLRDEALLQLQQQNLQALGEQYRSAKDRFEVGEVTRTDTALAEAASAGGRASLIQAQSNLNTSRAVYRQVVGTEPGKLTAGRPIDQLVPRSYDFAIADGLQRNPSVVSAQYAVDYAALQVKVAEGALLPSVNAQGILQRSNEPTVAGQAPGRGLDWTRRHRADLPRRRRIRRRSPGEGSARPDPHPDGRDTRPGALADRAVLEPVGGRAFQHSGGADTGERAADRAQGRAGGI